MSRQAQGLGPASGRTSAPTRRPRSLTRQQLLASRIGNRAMQRIAVGEVPAGLSAGAWPLQRDPLQDAKPDPKAGWWIKFQGSSTSHGDWLPLGNFSLTTTKGSGESSAIVDVVVNSPKGLHLGEALDAEEHITVLIEERQHRGSPHRQTLRDAVITSISETDEVNPTGALDPSGTVELTTKRRVIRVELRLADTATPSKR